MKKILSIARYTFIENVRNRVFYILILFGVVIIGASLLLAALGGEQQQRILLNIGLGAIEVFALLTVSFSAVTLILEEMESKTIYLVLTRPVPRGVYLFGRYLGLAAAVYCGMAIMSVMHLGVLLLKGWNPGLKYFIAILLSAEKITIISSLALFFSLFSSSAVSSVSFTFFLWVMGHFSEELNFLANKLQLVVPKLLIKAFYYIAPNLQYYNLKDFWDVPGLSIKWLSAASAYGVAYSLVFLFLSLWLFKNREF